MSKKTKLKKSGRSGKLQKTKKKTTNIIVLVELVSGCGFIYAREILSKFRLLVNEKKLLLVYIKSPSKIRKGGYFLCQKMRKNKRSS